MKKNRVLILGVLAIALTFGAVQKAEAQTNAFSDTAGRDNLFLSQFERSPYYIVCVGDEALQEVFGSFYSLNRAIEGLHYTITSGALWIFFDWETETDQGNRAVCIFFRSSRESIEKEKATQEKDGNITMVLGPFEAGTTDTTRRAALQRILTAANAYKKDWNIVPLQW